MKLLDDLVERIGADERLETLTGPLAGLVHRAVPRGAPKDILSGTLLGHPLHPLLTDIPIGSFTSATIVDLLGGRSGRRAADTLIAVGLLSALPTVAAGLADWSDTYGPAQRIGLVHASANAVGLGLYATSLAARLSGQRVRGVVLALAGMGVMTVGGYLGGHLTFAEGVGVNHAFAEEPPSGWTAVVGETPAADAAVAVTAGDLSVLVHRRGAQLRAIGNRCSHAGGPLVDGEIDADGTCVTCPWHASVFRLDDGSVVHGPATVPQVAYDVRTSAGAAVEVKARRAGR
jgi:nitrite reductase/ring-hydroxylating ferredoxin subunit/uncharacterized membrane protein